MGSGWKPGTRNDENENGNGKRAIKFGVLACPYRKQLSFPSSSYEGCETTATLATALYSVAECRTLGWAWYMLLRRWMPVFTSRFPFLFRFLVPDVQATTSSRVRVFTSSFYLFTWLFCWLYSAGEVALWLLSFRKPDYLSEESPG